MMSDNGTIFNSLVSEYGERLYWHIRGIVGNHGDTDDILQNVYLKVWKSLPGFRGDSGYFTWIWRIATNEALMHLRRERLRHLFVPVDEALGLSSSDFCGPEADIALQKAVNALPAKQRAVFTMRYYEDLSYEDISEITGTSVGALKASYSIAVSKIKKQIDD